MSTYQLTFIHENGAISASPHVGSRQFARAIIASWLVGGDYDRVCILEVPGPSTGIRSSACVFTKDEALQWARNHGSKI